MLTMQDIRNRSLVILVSQDRAIRTLSTVYGLMSPLSKVMQDLQGQMVGILR